MPKEGLLIDFQMPKTRRLVLLAIKEHGALTADQLAEMLNISTVAVRRHLGNLKNAQFIRYEEVQNGVGRPSYVYSLTERSQRIFPRNYQELAGDMLNTIKDLYGKKAVEAIFTKRTNKKIRNYRLLVNANTLSGRIEQLVSLRRADGYMPSWEEAEDHSFIINELNCPIQHVAEGCETACEEDLRIFSDLLDAQVTRVNHMMQGDNACCYKIVPK
ncbi:MAG: hypothetical protein B6243_03150 [Anaerolineaceae bacterium 4572_5.2]|nr:MAG: hypothetical protein B6243_03150 [Anaerolineaceae bacterium 4572_5.2]